jgi:drug/metabolite transporter (DMT)-like permease
VSYAVVVMVFGAFVAGGAISFHQQHKPRWTVVLLALTAAGLIGYGWYAWFEGR